MGKLRLHHFDMLKGLAIFMVVMGHVLTMCIRDIDNAVVFKFVERTHMPIFFFISGYFSYKLLENGKLAVPGIMARVKQLLIPFFVVSLLWVYYFPHSGLQSPFDSTWLGLYSSVGKNGYWFTLCLFEIIILYSAIVPLLSRMKNLPCRILLILAVWAVMGWLSDCGAISRWLGLPLVFEFFPIFMFGVIAKSEVDKFDRITASSRWITVSMILGACFMYYACWAWEFPFPYYCVYIAKVVLYVCVVIVAVAVVKPWSEKAFAEKPNGSPIARLWKYLGSQSLAIYLLHYFFLFPLSELREPLARMNLGFVPTFVVSAFFAALIITITLGVNYVICHSKLLALVLTGKVK